MPSWPDLKVTSYCVKYREYSLKGRESPRDLMKTLPVPITARASSINYYLGKKSSQTKEDQTHTPSIVLNFFWKALRHTESLSSSDYRMISRVPIFLPVSFSFSFSNIMELTADFFLLNFLKKFIFHWSIVVLYCCVGFCCTAKWISFMHMYIPSLLDREWSEVPCSIE